MKYRSVFIHSELKRLRLLSWILTIIESIVLIVVVISLIAMVVILGEVF